MQLQKALRNPMIGGQNGSENSEPKKNKGRAKRLKILTLLQLCMVIGVILAAWFYIRPQYSESASASSSAPRKSCGLVDGILFSPDKPSVLIDGHVLKEGDTIYGTMVVDIGRRIVTFEKNGKRWEQRVRQKPNSTWKEPELPSSNTNNNRAPANIAQAPPASKQADP